MRPSGYLVLLILSLTILSHSFTGPINAQEVPETSVPPLSVESDQDLYAQGNTVTISGFIKSIGDNPTDVTVIIQDAKGNIVSIAQVTPRGDGNYETSIIASGPLWKTTGEYTIKAQYGAQKAEAIFEFAGGEAPPPPPPPPPPEPEPEPEPTPVCGPGTVLKDGVCVPEETEERGGGCLIATATFGSELAPQVQMLREIRDNTVLNTASGTSFMTGFNQFYYSFSPTIADWERENPTFKEVVRVTITPLLTSLSILNHVDIDSEEEMLGYGIGVILLNLGMYFVAPAIVIIKLKNRK